MDKQDCDEEDGDEDLAAGRMDQLQNDGSQSDVDKLDDAVKEDGDLNLAAGGMDELRYDGGQDDVHDSDDEDEKVNAYALFD